MNLGGNDKMECLRCKEELKFLKEYRFDSQEANRGFFKAIFDVEEHLIFKIYVLYSYFNFHHPYYLNEVPLPLSLLSFLYSCNFLLCFHA